MSHDDRNLMRTFTAVDRRADLLVGVSLASGFPAALTVLLLVVSDIGQPGSLRLSLVAVLLGALSIGSALTATVLYQLRDVLWTLGTSAGSSAPGE